MKDKSSKPLVPDSEDKGMWENSDLEDREWQDATSDENEAGMWEELAQPNQDWRDATVAANEAGIWENLTVPDGDWRDTSTEENDSEIWVHPALVDQSWKDAPLDENESRIWAQTPISQSEWTEAPTKDDAEDKQKDGMVFLPKIVESQYYPLITLIGYCFLGLWLFDQINIIYPIKINDPLWVVETLGQIAERVPTLWIAFLFIFFRREGFIRKWEVGVLKLLSWLSLLLAIMFFLITPMLIGNTVRVYRLIDTQIDAKSSEQMERLKNARDQVKQTREQDISAYLQYQKSQQNTSRAITSRQYKENLLRQADKKLNELEINTKTLKDNQLGDLVKKTVKWSLGNLLSAFVCAWIWYLTRWTRIKNLELDSKV